MNYKSIAEKIIALKNADLALRNKLIRNKKLGEGYNEQMRMLHNENAGVLNDIIDKIGYPTIDKVGVEANDAAWLIIQHAIEQPDFMRKCAALLEKMTDENKTPSINLAYLTDRIAVFENKSQLYGTQFDWDKNGELNPNRFDDLKKVNQRRKLIGLNTLEEQTEMMRARVRTENQLPPADFEARKNEMEKWKRSVGSTK